MIDLDLINETTQNIIGQQLSVLALALVLIANAIVPITLGFAIRRLQGPESDNQAFPAIFAIISLIVLMILIMIGRTPYLIALGVLLLVTIALIVPGRHGRASRKEARRAPIAMAIIAAVGLGTAIALIPQVGKIEAASSAAADKELDRGITLISTSITDAYDVEILDQFPAITKEQQAPDFFDQIFSWASDGNQEHRDLTAGLEAFIDSTPEDYPMVKLLTSDGIIGSYGVLYDNESGTSRLVITDKDRDLPAPAALAKN